ncbi:DUF6348 family protein [Catenulispora yoronensis]|uniref:DUF6348 family protein n=1 Tax=Catenulispora yoronensis TaxID=450799 RepID=UPI0031CF381D
MTHPISEPRPGIPDERKLEIIRAKLDELTGPQWTLTDDGTITGRGSATVRLGEPHDDHPNHLDIDLILSRTHPAETTLSDCATGYSHDPDEAVRQAVDQWAQTTAQAAFELMEQRGQRAGHFPGHAPDGVPGWHAICGAAVGWGLDDGTGAKQRWLAENPPWIRIGPEIAAAMNRELNTLRMFIGSDADTELAEVRVNGQLHDELSARLLGMDWPRSARMTTARTYVLLIPERGEPAGDE